MKPLLLPLILLPLLAAISAAPTSAPSAPGGPFSGHKVLFIGIDGLRADALQQAMARGTSPHLKELMNGGTVTWNAYAGGELGSTTQQPTISGPGWTSILTGVWMNRHNISGNATPPCNQPDVRGSYLVEQAPHFAKRLKEAVPQAQVSSFVSWGWIETYLVAAQPEALDVHERGAGIKYPARDLNVKEKALAYLASASPDVMVVHFDQVDGAGHATGFSAENPVYMDAIQAVDAHIGELLAALHQRPQAAQEQWLVLVTTDHGGTGTKHGGQSPEERTIPMIANGPGVPAGQVIEAPVGQTVIPPTIFRYLNVPVSPSWGWEKGTFGVAGAIAGK